MSDTRVAMSEFRLLDDKRKLTPLSYAEEQQWLHLGQLLGIFESADYAAFSAPAEHPHGYYADDGNWYPYPQEYDPNAYPAGAESGPPYGAPYSPPDPYAAPQPYQDVGYDPIDHGAYHSSARANPGAPEVDPHHLQDAGLYPHPSSGSDPNAHYPHHPIGAPSEVFDYSPTAEQPAEAPMEVQPDDIMEVDPEDVMPVEPEPARARPASAIPELSLGLDLDSPLSAPEAALVNGRAPMDGGGGRATLAPALTQPEPSTAQPSPVDAAASAPFEEMPLLDFSETDPNAIQAAELPLSSNEALDAAAGAAPLPQASGQEKTLGGGDDELAPESRPVAPEAEGAASPGSPVPISWDEAVAGLPSAATDSREESAAEPGSPTPIPLDQALTADDGEAALRDAPGAIPLEPGLSAAEPQRELLPEIVAEGVQPKPPDESDIDQRSIFESLEQPRGAEETARQEDLESSSAAPSEAEVDQSGGTVIDLLDSDTLDSDSREAVAETTDVEFPRTHSTSLTASIEYAQSASSNASVSYVEQAPSPDDSADSPEPLLVPEPQAPPEPPQRQMAREPEPATQMASEPERATRMAREPEPPTRMAREQKPPTQMAREQKPPTQMAREPALRTQPQIAEPAELGSATGFGDGTQMLGSTFVQGEHRVVIHTLEGQVKRGTVRDLDLISDSVPIELQSGGGTDNVGVNRIKAIFFMLTPEMDRPVPQGRKIRVGFQDGREVVGFSNDYKSADPGFFLTPADSRTNTARIYIFRWSVAALAEL